MTIYKCHGKLVSVDFTVKHNMLHIRTVHIDSSLRARNTLGQDGDYAVRSINCPESRRWTIFLNGDDRGCDGTPTSCRYASSEDVKVARKAFQTIIRKINGSA